MNKRQIAIGLLALCAVLFVAAFQGPNQKLGVVNLSMVADKSKLGTKEKASFEAMRSRLQALLKFMDTNRVMRREQAARLRELWVMEKPTPEQVKELEALKTAVQAPSEELRTLLQKINPDQKDLDRIRELSPLANATADMLPTLDDNYTVMMRQKADETQQQVLEKTRAAVQKLGKRDAYTIVLEMSVAPYGANDVTQDVLEIMDKDNP